MDFKKLTEKAQDAVMTAQNIASEAQHAEITPEHLLVALVEQENGIVPSILRKLTLEPAQVAAEARALLDKLPKAYGAEARFAPRMKTVLDLANDEAERLQDEYISTEHLFVALAAEPGRSTAAQLLQRNGITRISSIGETLDPHRHQAMIEVPSEEAEPGTVVQELQSGYMIKDRLLRPALVGVARKP